MKKITTLLTVIIFGSTSLLRGLDTDPNTPTEGNITDTPPEQVYVDTPPDDTPKEVGKASDDALSSATRDTWIKFGIAAVAVAVAVVALVLVSNGKGKKS